VVNLHLHHDEDEEAIRIHQMWSILKWIDFNVSNEDLTVIIGDFNCTPTSQTYNTIIQKGYYSSHARVHGCEPDRTFHNMIDAPHKDASDDGTFDYIL
jgi:endonuclease/exonuclease/phosphatase family metal-dependent hydrolase